METNENEDTSVQNLWDTAKVALMGKYIATQVSIKKIENSRTQQLSLHLKELKNQQQIKPTPHIRMEIIKIRAEINEVETRDTVECINETRSWFLEESIRSINHWSH